MGFQSDITRQKLVADRSVDFRRRDFIDKANSVHDGRYDYSRADYVNARQPVIIICPEHGEFEQRPFNHLKGQGCPECARLERSLTRESFIERCKVLYGDKYDYSKVKYVNTKTKVDIICPEHGVFAITPDKHLSGQGCKKCLQQQIEQTNMERYGVRRPLQAKSIREKSRTTSREKYGVDNPAQNKEFIKKMISTKYENNTFNTSSSEDKLYELLCDRFGSDDIERQYVSEQYPYACDFYVKSLDFYIELNASWTHGHHWFGYCDDDAEILELWKSKNTDYYNNAVRVWSEKDLQKRQTAIDNNLNYAVFWDSKLRDAVLWFAMGCPVVKAEAARLYPWLPDRILRPDDIVLTGRSSKNISSVAKSYQFDVFYKRELKLFGSKVFKDSILLDLYLYSNRLQYLNKTPDQLSDLAILNGFSISGILRSYTTFDTALMEQVISKYDIRSVYDPCAGWGERMLCCYLHDIEYFGVDINTDLKPGYDKMISDLDMSKQSIVFEDSSEIKSMPVFRDVVITCPPYGSIEKYSKYGAENLSERDFLEWWHKVVEKCSDFRYFCFQINQRYKEPMKNIVENAGFALVEELVYSNNKSSHFTRKPGVNIKREFESMLIFEHK